jgi:hypothetical protein
MSKYSFASSEIMIARCDIIAFAFKLYNLRLSIDGQIKLTREPSSLIIFKMVLTRANHTSLYSP